MDFYLTTSASSFPCFQINWPKYAMKDDFMILISHDLFFGKRLANQILFLGQCLDNLIEKDFL